MIGWRYSWENVYFRDRLYATVSHYSYKPQSLLWHYTASSLSFITDCNHSSHCMQVFLLCLHWILSFELRRKRNICDFYIGFYLEGFNLYIRNASFCYIFVLKKGAFHSIQKWAVKGRDQKCYKTAVNMLMFFSLSIGECLSSIHNTLQV